MQFESSFNHPGSGLMPATCQKSFSLEITSSDIPCDLGVVDDTVIEANSAPDPNPLNDTLTYPATVGQYEFAWLQGAFQSEDNPCPVPPNNWKITQYRAIVNDGASVNNLVSGASYCGNSQAAVEAQMATDPFVVLSLYHYLTQIQHAYVGQNPTAFVAGSPNPTWRIRRTKKPGEDPLTTRVRIVNFATVSPALVGCSGATNAAGEPVWDGTYPISNFSSAFTAWSYTVDTSLGLQLNGKVIDTFSQLYHDAGQPTATGCAWILAVDFDFGFGSWVGMGGTGYSPVGVYTFDPTVVGFGLCEQRTDARAATAVALPANTRIGNVLTADANGSLPSIDGISLIVADRVLVKNEVLTENNGIYTVTDLGSAVTPWVLTRSTDADTSPEVIQGLFLEITEGATNGGFFYRLTTLDPIALNIDGLTFTQIPPTITVEAY